MKLSAALILSSSALLFAACGPSVTNQDSASNAIIGGTTDNGDPSVVALFGETDATTGEGALCTASVISPTVLVTAAHCVDPAELGTSTAQFFVIEGTDWSVKTDTVLQVASTHYDTAFDTSNPQNGHDIGIVVLAAATTLTPLPYNTADISSLTGNVKLVGYGLDDAAAQTGAGTKRTVTAAIDGIDDSLIQIGKTGDTTCNGDSGGPAFATINGVDTIVGLTSFGSQDCSGGGYDTRIDKYASLIAQYTGSSGGGGGGGGGGGTGGGSESEPNNTHATANAISNGAVTGTVSAANDQDWFSFTVTGKANYIVDLAAASATANITVYKQAASGNLSAVGTGVVGGNNGDRIVTRRSNDGGTYFVRVEDTAGASSDAYTLTVQQQ